MTVGPFLFLAPLALIGLIALPVIWYILRSTPPQPRDAELPSLRLLEGLLSTEEMPARTPWWILLMRLAAAALICLGLALPVFAPSRDAPDGAGGPVLVVVDNGWPSSERWSEMVSSTVATLLDGSVNENVHLLLTAPETRPQPVDESLTAAQLESTIRSLSPKPWTPDREQALERLEATDIQFGRIFWASDGLNSDSAIPFANALADRGPLTIFAAPPQRAFAISGTLNAADGVRLTVRRASADVPMTAFVSALSEDGSALATADADFEAGTTSAAATFALPPAILSRIASFRITGAASSGARWLWDSENRSRRVGLVAGDPTAQPLLSDMHYIRRAIGPFAILSEGNLEDLITEDPDAIILTDIGQIPGTSRDALIEWVESGGALIRFAGPRMAADRDELIPAPLRRSTRAIGGALTWEDPQPLGSFPETSPFAGLRVPKNVEVRRQVLARPGPDLADQTWARLADGSPLVTADRRGEGTLVLFHVTAGPDWSTLPYSGVFVEMLRRAIAVGRGEAVASEDGLYAPWRVLNGRGRLTTPDASATPIPGSELVTTEPSEQHPPGLYRGPAGTRALNAAVDYAPDLVTEWPARATVIGTEDTRRVRLGGLLISLAILLLIVDALIALMLIRALPWQKGRYVAQAGLALAALLLSPLPVAEAQSNSELSKEAEAALEFRLAYIPTGDADADAATRSGLEGLSYILYNRSSVEPAEPHAVDPEQDSLSVYPLIFVGLPTSPTSMSAEAISRLNAYLRNGGALFIDTRDSNAISGDSDFSILDEVFEGLDTPVLVRTPPDHVLTRSFYLLDGFPGRYGERPLWIEATGSGEADERRGDGVSRLFVGDADYLSAWAMDERGRPRYSVDGGEQEREYAYRFGINLVIYVLTGNYKEDQVHIPALLERLGEGDEGGVPGDGLPQDLVP